MRSLKGSHLQGGVDRTGDPILTSAVVHAMHIMLSVKRGDHEGLTLHPWLASEEDLAPHPACDPDPDTDPCIPKSSSCLLGSPVWDCLVPTQQLLV